MPNLYIIAGPNGAGKTTFAQTFLPNYANCVEFVNADLIAHGLSPFAPQNAAIQAGRLMLERIRTLGSHGVDFAFETTLSGKAYLPILRDLKEAAYSIHLYFLWFPEVELCVARVAERVRKGGHHVPEGDIRRRFDRGLRNLFEHYRPLLDSWIIYDNSGGEPVRVAYEENADLRIIDADRFAVIRERVGEI